MVAQPGPGTEPVHTLYDEQGNEIPAEVIKRVQDNDDDGSDREEVEDITVRDNRKVRKAKRAASHSTPGSKRRRKGRSPAVSTGPGALRQWTCSVQAEPLGSVVYQPLGWATEWT